MIKNQIFRKVFENGMKLIGVPTDSDIISIGIYVKVGSRYENDDNHGVAHFLEHMMFKGTKNISGKELSLKLDSVGAVYNAGTSYEYTYYYIYGHKNDINLFITLIFDLYFNPRFNDEDIKKERQVVLEELRMSSDDPTDILYDIIHKKKFVNSRLGYNILGSYESINKLTKKKLIDFRKKYYVPNNSVIVISGGFKPETIYKKIKSIITKYKSGELNDLENIKKLENINNVEINKKEKIHQHINKKLNQTHVVITFKSKPRDHKDTPKINLIEDLFSSGSSSRLFELLRNKMGVTYFNYSSNVIFEDDGFFMIHIGVDATKTIIAINAILKELKKIKNNGIIKSELNKIKKIRTTGFSLSLQDPRDLMKYYGLSELFYKNESYSIPHILKSYNKINLNEFNNNLKKILDFDNLMIFTNGQQIDNNKIKI